MKRNGLFLTTLAILLLGCGASDVNQKTGILSAGVPGNMRLSGSTQGQYMKPGAPVQLSYTSTKVQVGEISNIEAVLHLTKTDLDQVQVDVNTDPGIVLENSPDLSSFLTLESDKLDYPLTFSARSVELGLQYINLQVTTLRNGQKSNRAFSIPVQTGSDREIQAMKRSISPLEYDESGQAVVSMEAEETIK